MARNDIRVDKLADEIVNSIREYTEEVGESIGEAVDKTAKECVKQIREDSPRQSGEYAKGWRVVRRDRKGNINRVIWNPKHYRLVHLLEKGHAKRGGGRVEGKPHVGPAEKKYVKKLEQRVEQIIRNGG